MRAAAPIVGSTDVAPSERVQLRLMIARDPVSAWSRTRASRTLLPARQQVGDHETINRSEVPPRRLRLSSHMLRRSHQVKGGERAEFRDNAMDDQTA